MGCWDFNEHPIAARLHCNFSSNPALTFILRSGACNHRCASPRDVPDETNDFSAFIERQIEGLRRLCGRQKANSALGKMQVDQLLQGIKVYAVVIVEWRIQ